MERQGSVTATMTEHWSLLFIQLTKESLQTALIWSTFHVKLLEKVRWIIQTAAAWYDIFPSKQQLQDSVAEHATLFHKYNRFKWTLMQLKRQPQQQQKNHSPATLCGHKPQQISKDANMTHKVEMNTCWFTWEGWVIHSGADPEELWDCIKSRNGFQKRTFQAWKEGSRRMP